MRFSLLSACLVATLSTGIALAQSPVAYVYVAEDFPTAGPITSSPITVYAASSDGKLTPIKGSPFKQTTGLMVGTNGTHFLTLDDNDQTTDQYLRVYNVSSDGVIGSEVSKQNMHEWCGMNEGAELDHTGQFVYVLDDQGCGGGFQSFALSKSGELTFEGSLEDLPPFYLLPAFSGNDKFAYNFAPAPESEAPCPANTLIGLGKESSGALEKISFSETDPVPPAGDKVFQEGLLTDDPTNHLASAVYNASDGNQDCDASPAQLASYTVESNGDLVSTNTFENMPKLAGNLGVGGVMKLNPAGNILAVAVGTGIQFFHFNGAAPITTLTGIIGTSGYISNMVWDSDNHLYALNAKSGRLHVYTATSKSVTEAAGSPYLPQNSCTTGGCYPQTLVVRSIP